MTSSDPMRLLLSWQAAAREAGDPQADLMALSTTDASGEPRLRNVSMKPIEDHLIGFVTDGRSGKARDIAARPRVAVMFTWMTLRRQVTVRGAAVRMSEERAAREFHRRSRPARLGSWASHQSAPITDRGVLDAAFAAAERRWPEGTPVPVPPHWTGYVIDPAEFEFVQAGRPDRLHDRDRYRLAGDTWVRQVLGS
ncbi:pyridoxal 5'-phosphate synthase [Spongiactinospora sp. TRM90649]|uniref:pyridoxine/pyridoxamine 5'-phosphate oxidase n=1 Tax=Spongiactinospora sp. TRM90649 TaxID=3031114 RepID=UPI0023F75D93|nr:pyridoxal 5'-phosphate synthase [Spongiactinospora sp. TRM90649]MDF5751088.1 pyridoxal 5'-phosphate synthase [Spongiactinospora sp. TRM90649]